MVPLFRGESVPLFGTGARSKRPSHTDLFQRGLPEFGWRVKGESEMDDRWDMIWVFPKIMAPQIIHFNRVFHHKPSILGTPVFGNKGICVEFILDFCFLTVFVFVFFWYVEKSKLFHWRYLFSSFHFARILLFFASTIITTIFSVRASPRSFKFTHCICFTKGCWGENGFRLRGAQTPDPKKTGRCLVVDVSGS